MKLNCGGFNVFEVTSSGLTHTIDKNIFGMGEEFLKLVTPKTFYYSEPMVAYNYALFQLNKIRDDLKIEI